MGKPNTRDLDRQIKQTSHKLEAVQQRELWPLNGRERRAVLGALAGGSYRVVRGRSTDRAEGRLEAAWSAAQTRLISELTALQTERQRIVNEHAKTRAAKKSSGWW
ncbi:hypothetical protein ACFYN9_24855 [Streptomyces collinus]|uniref:hypothetical protein n=1 Tax=Streptomyces collinus TaxID=42684 RepID=UPI0036D0A3BC